MAKVSMFAPDFDFNPGFSHGKSAIRFLNSRSNSN